MNDSSFYSNWSDLLALLDTANKDQQLSPLLDILMTPDEKDVLQARVNIIYELLKGERNQRQISQLLGVGIATVTRGSNAVKKMNEQEKRAFMHLIEKVK
jgi:TrpR family trp operon transcriptional repressor